MMIGAVMELAKRFNCFLKRRSYYEFVAETESIEFNRVF